MTNATTKAILKGMKNAKYTRQEVQEVADQIVLMGGKATSGSVDQNEVTATVNGVRFIYQKNKGEKK